MCLHVSFKMFACKELKFANFTLKFLLWFYMDEFYVSLIGLNNLLNMYHIGLFLLELYVHASNDSSILLEISKMVYNHSMCKGSPASLWNDCSCTF